MKLVIFDKDLITINADKVVGVYHNGDDNNVYIDCIDGNDYTLEHYSFQEVNNKLKNSDRF